MNYKNRYEEYEEYKYKIWEEDILNVLSGEENEKYNKR